jgi:hypothetical protein
LLLHSTCHLKSKLLMLKKGVAVKEFCALYNMIDICRLQ